MKNTIYFTSGRNYSTQQLEAGIKSATTKRDAWLSKNKELIGKIDSEDIKITPFGSYDNNVMVTIQLTYYTKIK